VKKTKKLVLAKETVRNLEQGRLREIAGGSGWEHTNWASCPGCYQPTIDLACFN
jgi:hypothetical protein